MADILPGSLKLANNISAGASTFTLASEAHSLAKLARWVCVDAFTTQAEIRRVTSHSGANVSVSSPFTYSHSANDVLIWLASPIWNVELFGAKGDGVTDDTSAIQSALNAAAEVDNAVITLSNTIYQIGSTITLAADQCTVRGEGLPIIRLSGVGNVLTVTGNNCTLENLYITTGAASNNGYGIYLNGAYFTRVLKCTVYNIELDAVRLSNAWSCFFEHCIFDHRSGAVGTYAAYLGAASNNVTFLSTRFYAGGSGTCVLVTAGAQIGFRGCDFSGQTAGSSVGLNIEHCYGLTVDQCYFEDNCGTAIYVGTHATLIPVNIVIDSCWFNMGGSFGQVGIQVDRVYYLDIRACSFLGNSLGGEKSISVLQTAGAVIYGMSIDERFYSESVATDLNDSLKIAYSTADKFTSWSTAAPTNNGVTYLRGQVVWNSNATSGGYAGWICTNTGSGSKGYWATSTAYSTSDYVVNATKLYRATSSGTSGATAPTHTSGTASDGGVTWLYIKSGVDIAIWKQFGAIA